MLTIKQPNRVTFDVNVFGTATTPTVRCVLGEAPGLTFPAVKLADGKYEVLINLPDGTRPGGMAFKIEVLVNGRLFTPIQTTVAVTGDETAPTTIEPVAAPAAVKPAEPAAEPILPRIDAEVTPRQQLPEEPKREAQEEQAPAENEQLIAGVKSLIQDLAASSVQKTPEAVVPVLKPAQLSSLQATVDAPVQKLKPRVTEAPAAPVIKSVKISMASIAEAAEQIEPRAPKKAPKPAPKKTVKESPSIPVSLSRGSIVYL